MGSKGPRSPTAPAGETPMLDTTLVAPAGPAPRAERLPIAFVEPPPAPPPGERFQLGAEVARGGMGRVVAARDERLGRRVAIKEALDADPSSLRRFEREVQITARLQHPAIVPLYDAGYWPSGLPYYVMRLVSGRPLLERIHEAGSLNGRLGLVPNFLAAADAVGFAHREGVIHRDLKPANVLVGEHGETVVIDWGLAKVLDDRTDDDGERAPSFPVRYDPMARTPRIDSETRAGAVLGTPGYMAPEQAAGDPVDARTDVYALGATLYHLLAGGPPITATHVTAAIGEAMSGRPSNLARRVPGTPPELVAIVDKAMAANPDDRYQDGTALAADVRRFLTGQLVAAHRYSAADRLRRFAARHRAALAVAALGTVLLVSSVAIGFSRVVAARERAESARADAEAGWRSAEEARRRAADRADDLLLARAHALVDADPTGAAALVGRLPVDSRQWPRARAILMAARSRGIARSLPGTRDLVILLEAEPGAGRRLLSADRAGKVEVHDLEAGTSRVIAEGERVSGAQWADGGRAVAIARGSEIVVIDLAGGERRSIALPAPLEYLDAPDDASFLVWRDAVGEAAMAAPPAWTPSRLLAPTKKRGFVRVSADGRWIATRATDEPLRVWQRGRARPILTAPVGCEVAFHPRAARAAVACARQVVEHDLERTPPPVLSRWNRNSLLAMSAYGGDQLYDLTGHGEVIALYKSGLSETVTTSTSALFPIQTPSGMALSSGGDSVVLIEPGWNHTLRAPASRIIRLASARGGRVVAAGATDGRILLYDVDAVRPLRIPVERGITGIMALRADAAIIGRASGDVAEIDLTTATTRSLGSIPGFPDRWGSNLDTSLLLVSSITGELTVMRTSDGAQEALVDDGHALAALSGPDTAAWIVRGELWEKRLFSGAEPVRLASWRSRSTTIAAESGWLAGGLENGTVWRRAPGQKTIEEVETGLVLGGGLALGGDGTVYVTVGREVWRWTDRLQRVAVLSGTAFQLAFDPELGLSAVTQDSAAHLIALDGTVRTTLLPGVRFPIELSQRGARAMARSSANHPIAIDLAGGVSHTLLPGWALSAVIAVDGTSSAALTNRNELVLYKHDLPREPAALRDWLAHATNARIDESGAVAWP